MILRSFGMDTTTTAATATTMAMISTRLAASLAGSLRSRSSDIEVNSSRLTSSTACTMNPLTPSSAPVATAAPAGTP